jgi:hypothetical protein
MSNKYCINFVFNVNTLILYYKKEQYKYFILKIYFNAMKHKFQFFFTLFKIVLFQFFIGNNLCSYAQFTTPTINGSIGTNEYGDHTSGQNYGDNWFMTWDNTNLYIGLQSSNIGEGCVIYLKSSTPVPINSGTNADGTNIGANYDGTGFAELPFRANLVIYVKNTYREYKTATTSNTWGTPTLSFGDYADNGSNVREFSIPWSVIGGRPASFVWFGYVTSSGGSAYNQTPFENPSGNFGTGARPERYFIINDTNHNAGIKPFARNCFVFNRTSDWDGNSGLHNDIQCWDFTMNTSGRTITRRTIGGYKNWDISGSLIIAAGTIDCSNPDYSISGTVAQTNIGQDLIILGGTLNMNQNREVLITQNFIMTSGNLILATNATINGGMALSGNWTRTGGTFTPNNKEVTFNGATNLQTLQTTGGETFYNLTVNKNNNILLRLLSDVNVSNLLKITQGDLDLNNNNINLLTSGSLQEDIFNGHLVKDNTAIDDYTQGGKIIASARLVTNTPTDLSGLGIILSNPTNYNVDIERMHYRGGNAGVRRIYRLVGTPTSTNISILYSEEEIPSPILESHGFLMYRWTSITGWVTQTDSFHNQTTNRVDKTTPINAFSHWTVGSQFIPLNTHFLFLEGEKEVNRQVNLKWKVNPESQTIGYWIQKSNNGIDFQDIIFRDAIGNQNNLQNYTQNYIQLEEGVYYRIKQKLQNQSYVYSNVIWLKYEDIYFDIFPNPSFESVYINMPEKWKNNNFLLVITDLNGKIIQKMEVKGNQIQQNLQKMLISLPKATYILQTQNLENSTKKFLFKWILN